MWHITLNGAVAHRVRYALTALAVVLGVAFMAGTLVFTDTIHATFNGLYGQIYRSTGAVVRATQAFQPTTNFTSQRHLIDAGLAATVAGAPGVKAVGLDVEGYAQLVGHDGKVLGVSTNGPPTLGLAWIDNRALNELRLLPGGNPPRTSSQIVIDQHSAQVGKFKVGDSVKVLTQVSPATYTIVGIATWGTASSPLGASITAFDEPTAARVLGQPGKVTQLDVEAQPGVSQGQLVRNIQAMLHTPGVEVVSGTVVTQEGQNAVAQALSVFNTFLLIFALIALLVGAFLIFNTFSIVVAQRTRELALLRAVGASSKQVVRSVLGESLILGVVASAGGLAAGVGVAVLLRAGLSALGMAMPAAGLVITWRTVIVALLAGTAITLASAIQPARRAARVAPVVAMQGPAATADPISARRIRVSLGVTAIGGAAVVAGLVGHLSSPIVPVSVGALLMLVGLFRLGPVVSGPVIRTISAPIARRGTTGKLARQNALRNPSRTSTTAAALMIGVALMAVMSVFASSIKSSVNAAIASGMKADLVIGTGGNGPGASGLSPVLAQSLAGLPQVGAVTGIRASYAQVYGKTATVQASDPTQSGALFNLGVTQGSLAAMTQDGVSISTNFATQHHLGLGSTLYMVFPSTGRRAFAVEVVYSARQFAGDLNLTLGAAQANFAQNFDQQVYLKLAPGVSTSAGRQALDKVLGAYPNATVMDQAQYRAQQSKQVNVLLDLSYGLLALAVIIALIGIANTLALSIYERTRELGLLRAVGMTRAQLRSSIRLEALIISVLGTLEGLVLGVLLGVAMVRALHSQGVTNMGIPVPQLLILAAIAAAAGAAAASRPARRAAHLDVLQAIITE